MLKKRFFFKTNKQQGYTLFIVLMMMLVIAFIVISNMQANTTEMRISSNDADRKYAFSNAENALNRAEQRIISGKHAIFDAAPAGNCKDGLCGTDASKTNPVWSKTGDQLKPGSTASCINNKTTDNNCYVIERLGKVVDGRAIFRITARSWGSNANTVVTLQSYVEYSEE